MQDFVEEKNISKPCSQKDDDCSDLCFFRWGVIVATYPYYFIVGGLLFTTVCGLGLVNFTLENRPVSHRVLCIKMYCLICKKFGTKILCKKNYQNLGSIMDTPGFIIRFKYGMASF